MFGFVSYFRAPSQNQRTFPISFGIKMQLCNIDMHSCNLSTRANWPHTGCVCFSSSCLGSCGLANNNSLLGSIINSTLAPVNSSHTKHIKNTISSVNHVGNKNNYTVQNNGAAPTSSLLQACRTRSVFLHTFSTVVFPCTQVMPRSSTLGAASANMMAWASSTPQSASTNSFFLTMVPEGQRL